jgi:hypothetical protein
MDISNYIDTAVFAVIGALITAAFRYGVPVIIDLLIKLHAGQLVKAAEAIYSGSGLGDAKYQFVADALVAYAAKFHVKLDATRVKTYIEAAVTDLHVAINGAVKQITDATNESK